MSLIMFPHKEANYLRNQIKDIINRFFEEKSLHRDYEWTEMKFE